MRERRFSTHEREFLSIRADLDRLRRLADAWRAIGRTEALNEIDRAIAELERHREREIDRS